MRDIGQAQATTVTAEHSPQLVTSDGSFKACGGVRELGIGGGAGSEERSAFPGYRIFAGCPALSLELR